ncbi:MAG TPA: hypothetical protein VFS22_10185 [Flavisolibacter sp.]|nr:hypothetical protein [Flavisolibacter sp.]
MEEKTLEQLQQENADLQAEVASLKEEVETVNAVNEELQAKIEDLSTGKSIGEEGEKAQKKEKAVLPTETFTVDGQAYKFISPVFMYQKERIVAATALKDESLLAKLVAAKLGVIVEA